MATKFHSFLFLFEKLCFTLAHDTHSQIVRPLKADLYFAYVFIFYNNLYAGIQGINQFLEYHKSSFVLLSLLLSCFSFVYSHF